MCKWGDILKLETGKQLSLFDLPIGTCGKVTGITIDGVMRRRLMDLGFVPGSVIKAVRKSPIGDPIAYEVKGTILGLRKEESTKILININSTDE